MAHNSTYTCTLYILNIHNYLQLFSLYSYLFYTTLQSFINDQYVHEFLLFIIQLSDYFLINMYNHVVVFIIIIIIIIIVICNSNHGLDLHFEN